VMLSPLGGFGGSQPLTDPSPYGVNNLDLIVYMVGFPHLLKVVIYLGLDSR
jgi:hypothetical protein